MIILRNGLKHKELLCEYLNHAEGSASLMAVGILAA